jgi:AraC-like DNA-binding protein
MALMGGHVAEAHAQAHGHAYRPIRGGLDFAFNVLHIEAARAVAKGDAINAIRNYAGMTHVKFDASKRCEGLAGMALVYLSLADIETSAMLIDQLIEISPENSDWGLLGWMMKEDIQGLRKLHSFTSLRDHIYWHQSIFDHQISKTIGTDTGRYQKEGAELILCAMRLAQVAIRAGTSGPLSIQNLYHHYQWGGRELSQSHVVNIRIEQAKIIIAHNQPQFLTQVMASIDRESLMSSPSYTDFQRLELCYCFSKLFRSQGDAARASEHYKNYLTLSANRIRLRAAVGDYCEAQIRKTNTPTSDDVSARLPARYRRAYQYMQTHLDQNDLSVQAIADVIDVSARALQHAFKKYLGESPTEVLRRRRIEHVHGALLNVTNHTLIMDIAKKFGINNRTTLSNEYRKLYAELPSRTLKMGSSYSPR